MLDTLPWRAVLAVVLIAFYGWVAYKLVTWLIGHVIGDGVWKRGAWKFALSVAAAWFSIIALQRIAILSFEATPFGDAYYAATVAYQDKCETLVRDDENSGHYEVDWHSGESACRALAERRHSIYPGPARLFGPKPSSN